MPWGEAEGKASKLALHFKRLRELAACHRQVLPFAAKALARCEGWQSASCALPLRGRCKLRCPSVMNYKEIRVSNFLLEDPIEGPLCELGRVVPACVLGWGRLGDLLGQLAGSFNLIWMAFCISEGPFYGFFSTSSTSPCQRTNPDPSRTHLDQRLSGLVIDLSGCKGPRKGSQKWCGGYIPYVKVMFLFPSLTLPICLGVDHVPSVRSVQKPDGRWERRQSAATFPPRPSHCRGQGRGEPCTTSGGSCFSPKRGQKVIAMDLPFPNNSRHGALPISLLHSTLAKRMVLRESRQKETQVHVVHIFLFGKVSASDCQRLRVLLGSAHGPTFGQATLISPRGQTLSASWRISGCCWDPRASRHSKGLVQLWGIHFGLFDEVVRRL